MPEPLDSHPRRRRSVATWSLLIAVWLVGLVIWGIYLAVILVVVLKLI